MNYLEQALTRINSIPQNDVERIETLENEVKDLRAALDALLEKLAG